MQQDYFRKLVDKKTNVQYNEENIAARKKKGWDDGTERKRLYYTGSHTADHTGFIFFTVCPLQKSEESMDPRDPFFSAACGTDRSCGMCAVTGRRLYGFSYAGSAFMRNLRDHLSGADPDCAICLSKKTQ